MQAEEILKTLRERIEKDFPDRETSENDHKLYCQRAALGVVDLALVSQDLFEVRSANNMLTRYLAKMGMKQYPEAKEWPQTLKYCNWILSMRLEELLLLTATAVRNCIYMYHVEESYDPSLNLPSRLPYAAREIVGHVNYQRNQRKSKGA